MRIALSGSAGTGKTTLGHALAESLDLPFVEEGMRERIGAGLAPATLTAEAYEDLIESLWDEQREREDSHANGFVADRSPIDFAAFWLHYGSLHDRQRTDRRMRAWLEELSCYDRIVLLPWGVLPLEDDGVRSTDRWLQFRFQAIVEGLHRRHTLAPRLLVVPDELTELEDRRAWVLERVDAD